MNSWGLCSFTDKSVWSEEFGDNYSKNTLITKQSNRFQTTEWKYVWIHAHTVGKFVRIENPNHAHQPLTPTSHLRILSYLEEQNRGMVWQSPSFPVWGGGGGGNQKVLRDNPYLSRRQALLTVLALHIAWLTNLLYPATVSWDSVAISQSL